MAYYPPINIVCRWCGIDLGRYPRGQFCSNKCKQALHRAYKRYVTYLNDRQKGLVRSKPRSRKSSNARPKRGKRKC